MADETGADFSKLLADLGSPLDDVRLAALRGLAHVPCLAALGVLRRIAATDSSVTLRFEARRMLTAWSESQGTAAPTPDELGSWMTASDPQSRAKAAGWLARSRDPQAPKLVATLLAREREPYVLCALVQALAATAGESAASAVARYLAHADARVRTAALDAVEASGGPSALRRLLPLAADPHPGVRARAMRALRARDRNVLLACLDDVLREAIPAELEPACLVLGYFDESTAVPRLAEKLSGPAVGRGPAAAALSGMARRGSRAAARALARSGVTAGQTGAASLAADADSPVAEALETALTAETPEQRVAAIREAVRAGRADLLKPMQRLLATESEPRVLATLASAIGKLGHGADVACLVPLLRSSESRVRANAVEAIGHLGGAGTVELLTPHLADSSCRVRANAAVALRSAPGVDLDGVLRGMAFGQGPVAASSAIWAAAAIANTGAVSLLEELLASTDRDTASRARSALSVLGPVMREAAIALARGGGSRPEPLDAAPPSTALPESKLRRLVFDLRHESAQVRQETLRKIGDVRDVRLVPAVQDLLRDPDPAVRHAARDTLGAMLRSAPAIGAAAAASELSAFEAGLNAGGAAAERALGAFMGVCLKAGAAATAAVLARRLASDPDPLRRSRLLSALGLAGDASHLPAIRSSLQDPDPRVRANAVEAFAALAPETDLPSVMTCLADPDSRVRASAIRATSALYPEPFLGHLRFLLASPSAAERSAALYVARTVGFPGKLELLRGHFLVETDDQILETSAGALAGELATRPQELNSLLAALPDAKRREILQTAAAKFLPPAAEEPRAADPDASQADAGSLTQALDMDRLGLFSPEEIRRSLARTKEPVALCFALETAAQKEFTDAVDLFTPFTHAKDRRVRLAAADALGKTGKPGAADALAPLVRDHDAAVARRALERLAALDPIRAREALVSLLELGQPWATRQGLELLETLGDPAGLELVFGVLERGAGSSAVEPTARLVEAWGDRATLQRIAAIYAKALPAHRPFALELGRTLGRKLGVDDAQLTKLFPGQSEETVPALPDALPRIETAWRPRVPPRALVAAGAGAAVFLLLALMPGGSQVPSRMVIAASTARRGQIAIPAARPVAVPDPASMSIAAPGFFPAPEDQPPTLEEVEAGLKIALAPQGIQHAGLIHLLALDRVQITHLQAIARARELTLEAQFDAALRLLEEALGKLDAEHLTGRLAVLLALESTCRQGRRYQRIAEWRAQLKELQGKLLELCIDAGRESGVSEEDLRRAVLGMEKEQAQKAGVTRGADFFSGASMTQEPEPAEDAEPEILSEAPPGTPDAKVEEAIGDAEGE